MHWPKKLKNKKFSDSRANVSDFSLTRKKLLKTSLISISITLVALAIVGLKLLYPFHVVIGVTFYIISYIPFFYRIYASRKTWQKYHTYKYARTFFIKEWIRLAFALVFIVLSISFLWLRPLDEKPFKDMSLDEIRILVKDDLYQSITAMDYLETTGNELLTELESNREDVNTTENISNKFDQFLMAVSFSESLTDRHRYFASIPYRLWNDRVSSFLISYSLYVKKYEIVHRIMMTVSGNEYKKKVLNQYMPHVERSGVYTEMVTRFYMPKTRLRLSGGLLYMRMFGFPNDYRVGPFELLYKKANSSYGYLFKNIKTTIVKTGEVLVSNIEERMFDTWFPIQKTVANAMGKAILTTRGKDGFITEEQALEMEKEMLPGDFMLQRRNWHLSNVGIPGFWTHAVFYTGSLEKMNEYFASEFPYEGFDDFSSYIKEKFPEIYDSYTKNDVDGYPKSVIEAIDPAVLIQSITKSSDADFVVVLRPYLLSKRDVMLAVLKAFDNVGKPYDYNFDFDTRDAIVCSELVFDALFERPPEKTGVSFATSLLNGRKMVSPLDMAKKFANEYGGDDAELSFIYFLRGNEKTEVSRVASVEEFLESLSWSKFSFFQK